MINRNVSTTVMTVALVVATSYGSLWAQEQKPQRRPGPLRGLSRALKAAGAPEVTEGQREQLQTLLKDFHAARKAERADKGRSGMGEARQAYADAILNSDNARAQAMADVIVSDVTTTMLANLQNQASLKIQVLNILTQDQVDALLQRSGTRGLSRVLGSIAGPRGQGRKPAPQGQQGPPGPPGGQQRPPGPLGGVENDVGGYQDLGY